MSLMTGFAILVGEAVIGFWKKVHAINFGVYGATALFTIKPKGILKARPIML